jgi:hypothetical protein
MVTRARQSAPAERTGSVMRRAIAFAVVVAAAASVWPAVRNFVARHTDTQVHRINR